MELAMALLVFSIGDAFAMGQAPGSGGSAQGGIFGFLLPLILMFAVLYFFMIRPAQKRQKDKDRMLAALKKGDRVVTSGGIYGEITQVKEHSLVVRISENVKIELQRNSVSSLTEKGAEEKEAT